MYDFYLSTIYAYNNCARTSSLMLKIWFLHLILDVVVLDLSIRIRHQYLCYVICVEKVYQTIPSNSFAVVSFFFLMKNLMDAYHQNPKRKRENIALGTSTACPLKKKWVGSKKKVDRASQCFMSSRVMPFCALVWLGIAACGLPWCLVLWCLSFILQARSTLSGRVSAWWWWFSGRIKLLLHNANGFAHKMDSLTGRPNIKNRKTLNCPSGPTYALRRHIHGEDRSVPFDPLAGKCFVHPADVHELLGYKRPWVRLKK